MSATTTAGATTRRARVGWGDLAWLTWRQHRWTVLATAVPVLAAIAPALGMALHVDATGDTHELLGEWSYLSVAQALALLPGPLGLVIAVFWAAPLLSREYEQRTHLLVWSQDVPPLRWLAAKVVLLGAAAAGLAAGLGLALVTLMNSLNAVHDGYPPFHPFGSDAFEAAPHVQAGYAVFGFALGLLAGATTRRTVPAMGLALVGLGAARLLVARLWRPHYDEPLRRVTPYEQYARSPDLGRDGAYRVAGGYADPAGNEIPFPAGCHGATSNDGYIGCLVDHDVHYFVDYHPVERLASFQLIEFSIFAGLAAALFALAFAAVRRARRV
ncbi:hypothetical protein ACFXGA_16035 [Actinosynnema sp. NPDC059335]|uniref:hypothetical protein n=1 Tax=Actinosynnema sp. NPDC059335 TaxID=3346804 RepID=UPI00366DB869